MLSYSISKIATILNGSIELIEDKIIEAVAIDSRNIQLGSSNILFFCLVGEQNNGHRYIQKCYENGIRNFVISDTIDCSKYPDANFIRVANTLKALQTFAQFHRLQFSIPVIGITGSNGKTIIKEWLYQLLSSDKNVVKSPKSYNSQVGVPLSVLNMEPSNEIAIFEAGISTIGQMTNLEKIIHPTIGIFSNIGPAHDAGFSSLEEKIEEKLCLFKNCNSLIYCAEYKEIHQKLKDNNNIVAWKAIQQSGQDFTIEIYNSIKNSTQLLNLKIHFKDKASIENCIHCIVTLSILDYKQDEIQQKISLLRNLPMRLELKYGINQCTIIDDTYSADFLSLQIAIDFLNQQDTNQSKTLILSDFEDSGLSSEAFIDKLNKITSSHKFDKLIGVGKGFVQHQAAIKNISKIIVFESTFDLLNAIDNLSFHREIILIKGARKFGFESIIKYLVEKTHETILEINLNSMIHNLNVYRGLLKRDVGIIAMVKAYSYGNGSIELASLLEQNKVEYLAVAYADEGVALRRHGIHSKILVMNPDKVDFQRMLQYQLEPEIYSLSILKELIENVGTASIDIHLKIETGMNRLGFSENELNTLIEQLNLHKNIKVQTVFSHLAGSEDAAIDTFTNEQIQKFSKIATFIENGLGYSIKRHILNSAGIVRFPEAQFNFVRLGIGLYGVDGSGQIQHKLEPIGKLKTRIAQIKSVKSNETIGYSRKWKIQKDSTIGTLAIGYADGFDRRFGNGVGEVFIAGKRAKILGNICMDMCMVDLTDIPEAKVGDEVEVYGKNISIIQQAEKIGTIPYELLTSISSRVKRVYFLD